jgi:hypothetical protein
LVALGAALGGLLVALVVGLAWLRLELGSEFRVYSSLQQQRLELGLGLGIGLGVAGSVKDKVLYPVDVAAQRRILEIEPKIISETGCFGTPGSAEENNACVWGGRF